MTVFGHCFPCVTVGSNTGLDAKWHAKVSEGGSTVSTRQEDEAELVGLLGKINATTWTDVEKNSGMLSNGSSSCGRSAVTWRS